MPHSSPLDALIRKLESTTAVSDEEREAVLRLPYNVKELRADQDIVRDGDHPTHCCLLLEGFLCRYKMMPNGSRQILAFHIPGEIPDLQSLFLRRMDHSLSTIVPNKVAFIAHEPLRALLRDHFRLVETLWRESLIDASIFREWIVNVGVREAPSRIAHLICEQFTKLKSIGMTDGNSFDFPVTQSEIGEATGMTTVHVNRSLQKLRTDRLITFEKGYCTIHNWKGLQELAMFEPDYLHLQPEKSA